MAYDCAGGKTPTIYEFEGNIESCSFKLSDHVPQRLRNKLERSARLSKGKTVSLPMHERLSQAENRRKDYQRAKLESIQRCDSRLKVLDDKMQTFEHDEESSNSNAQKSHSNNTRCRSNLVNTMKESD